MFRYIIVGHTHKICLGGGGKSETSEWGGSWLHVQKAGKRWCQVIGGAYCTICASYNSNYRMRYSNMRLAYAATYIHPGPHVPHILSNIGGAYDHMCLAYSSTYQHAGTHRLCEPH